MGFCIDIKNIAVELNRVATEILVLTERLEDLGEDAIQSDLCELDDIYSDALPSVTALAKQLAYIQGAREKLRIQIHGLECEA